VKEPDAEDCYLFNNDSYHFPRGPASSLEDAARRVPSRRGRQRR
jgi:hypothetical protein